MGGAVSGGPLDPLRLYSFHIYHIMVSLPHISVILLKVGIIPNPSCFFRTKGRTLLFSFKKKPLLLAASGKKQGLSVSYLLFPVLPGLIQVQKPPGKGHQVLGGLVAHEFGIQVLQADSVQVVCILQQTGEFHRPGIVLRLEGS